MLFLYIDIKKNAGSTTIQSVVGGTDVVVPVKHVLYPGWTRSIPSYDQDWILKSVFIQGKKMIQPRTPLQLWYRSPPPALIYNQPPRSADRFFGTRLLYWAPYELFDVLLSCPQPSCRGHQLTSSSKTYKHTVRQVLDVDGYYNLAAEYLECTSCQRRYIPWSDVILDQLDVGHRSQFPIILTYRFVSISIF